MISLRNIALLAALIISLSAVGSVAYYQSLASQSQGPPSGDFGSHGAFAYDVSDKRKLVGAAENVFIGQVQEQKTTVTIPDTGPPPGVPYTRYSVEVQRNIKGDLSGTVTVSQQGGVVSYIPESGPEAGQRIRELQALNGDTLLNTGKPYLFVTRYDESGDFYQITTPKLSDIPIDNQQERESLVKAFEKAQADQINPYGGELPQ